MMSSNPLATTAEISVKNIPQDGAFRNCIWESFHPSAFKANGADDEKGLFGFYPPMVKAMKDYEKALFIDA